MRSLLVTGSVRRRHRRGRGRLPAASALVLAIVATLVVGVEPGLAAVTTDPPCVPTNRAIAAGSDHTLFLNWDGTVWATGWNGVGNLGDGTTTDRLSPVRVQDLTNVVAVEAGGIDSFAITAEGSLYGWGLNNVGQLGDGTTINRHKPVRVSGLPAIEQVEAGSSHTLARARNGTIWVWGDNADGQLGDGSYTSRLTPFQIPSLVGVKSISVSADGWHSMVLLDNGDVYSWGSNYYGQLGDGTKTDRNYPVKVSGLSDVVAIDAGYLHSVALKSDGTVWAWGNNWYGQIGDGGALTERLTPVQVATLTNVESVDAGGNHTLAVRSDGTAWGWGYNARGGVGDGTVTNRNSPVRVAIISDVKAIRGGANGHSTALTGDGRLWTWGANEDGQIGDGSTGDRLAPHPQTTLKHKPPSTPTELAAVAGEELAYLTWEAPDEVVTQYVITPYLNGVAQPEIPVTPELTEYAVSGLTEGYTYSFTIAAQNCLGTSAVTDETERVVPTGVQLNDEGFSVEGVRVNDRMELDVNLFNGNLTLSAKDLFIQGTGLDVQLDRAFRSRDDQTSVFGNKWVSSLGTDVRLETLSGGSMFFHGPGGGSVGFAKRTDGTFATPAGVDADLTLNPDGTYTLEQHYSGEIMQFDTAGKLTEHADRNGNAVTYAYNASSQLTSITDTQSRAITLSYTSGLVTKITDATGRQWAYGYDTSDNLRTYTDPEGGSTSFDYDSSDRLTKITTPEGRVVEIGYDTVGRVTSLGWPLETGSPATSFTYNSQSTVVTDANGGDTTYVFDPVGRTLGVADALGNETATEYTAHSNVKTHRGAAGNTTSAGYDSATNPVAVTYPTTAQYTASYGDPAHPHLPTIAMDAQGNALQFDYDTNGNLTTLTNQLPIPGSNKVHLTYNSKGLLATSTDANGNTTSYGYDTVGNQTSMTPPPPLGSSSIGYDALSRVTSTTDGKGQTTTYAYDDLDRVTKIAYSDGTSVEYTYDGDGNLTQQTDNTGTTRMSYGPRNQLIERITPDGTSIRYEHDEVGNLASVSDANGEVTYTYNAINLPTKVRHPDGRTTNMTYDANHNRTSVIHPNGVTLTTVHDGSDRVESMSWVRGTSTLVSFTYDYRKPSSGNPDTMLRYKMTDMDGNVTSYEYDRLNRLRYARTIDPSGRLIVQHGYTYDGVGNRLSHTRDDGVTTLLDLYAYNAANQLTSVNGETVSYDANGNLIGTSTGAQVTYNAADQTTSIRSRVTDGTYSEYMYRGPGQTERIAAGPVARRVSTSGSACVPLVTCVSDPDVPVAAIAFEHSTLGVSAEHVATDDVVSTTSFVRDPEGRLLAARTATDTWYYLTDGIGSVVAVTDAGGTVIAEYQYGPFGQTTLAVGPAAEVNPWRFAGAYQDASGLYKMGQRYYHPAWGRWTQQDPLIAPVDPLNWNRYVYAGNNPVNYTDPTGLAACDSSFLTDLSGFFGFFSNSDRTGVGSTVAKGVLVYGSRHLIRFGSAAKQGTDFFSAAAKAAKIVGRVSLGITGFATGFNLYCRGK